MTAVQPKARLRMNCLQYALRHFLWQKELYRFQRLGAEAVDADTRVLEAGCIQLVVQSG